MAQVSAASVGHIPHLVPHSPPTADIAERALTIVIPTWGLCSRSRPEVGPLSRVLRLGVASPSLCPLVASLYLHILPLHLRIPHLDLRISLLDLRVAL